MFQILTVAVAALATWTGALWLLLPIDIFRYSLLSIIAMHVAVPTLAVGAWFSVRFWIQKLRYAKVVNAETAQQNIKIAEKTRLKNLFEELLRIRRTAINCRWAAIADVVFWNGSTQLTEDTEQTHTREYAADSIYSWPQPTLIRLFQELFAAIPGASGLPIAICASSHATDGVEKIVRQAHAIAVDQLGIVVTCNATPDVLFLSEGDVHPFTQLHDVFFKHRELPGLIVVAFDSLLKDEAESNDWFDSADTQSEREKWHGKPNRSVCLLLLSPNELESVLSTLADLGSDALLDNLTPHWERQQIPLGMARFLMKWPKIWREGFIAMPPIASLQRSTAIVLSENASTKQRVQGVRDAMGEAAIDASLIEPEFVFEGEVDSNGKADAKSISTCGWLIHNAGDVSVCGERLALLGVSMLQHDMEIDPINQATNTVMAVGDCGTASHWLSLALAIQRVANNHKPALCAVFNRSELLISFVLPVSKK